MMEFGAKLSLKDSMYATLQKNLQKQKEFSKQIQQTRKAIRDTSKEKLKLVMDKTGATKAIQEVNKVRDRLKAVGRTVARPFIKAKDMASSIISKVHSGLKKVGSFIAKPVIAIKDGASKALSGMGGMLKSLAKGATIAIGIAGAGATALLGGALSQGASLEQSIGGVETLFKDDAGKVKANADMAFKTAGLSANAYMETVTGFSASLLSSLGGDTAKSAKIADMAIIDMADNANKFGTDMEAIQNAYQGFAKQNYTMLDNLKLGYGGTKEEMSRLLKDANKLTGVKYDISNLSDVYSAINAIQTNLGVTGTTALEASSTFSGSFASMKASVSNLLGNMAIGGDVAGSMESVVDSMATFLFDNAIPMIGKVFSSLPDAIRVGIKKSAPKIKEAGGSIIKSLKDGMVSILPSSMGGMVDPMFNAIGSGLKGAIGGIKSIISGLVPVVTNIISTMAPVVGEIGAMFERMAPIITDALGKSFGNSGGFIESFKGIIESAIPIVEGLVTNLLLVFEAIQPIIFSLWQSAQRIFPMIGNVILQGFNLAIPIINIFKNIISSAMPIVETIISAFCGAVQTLLPIVSTIFQGVSEKVGVVIDFIGSKMGFIKEIFDFVVPLIADILSVAWSIISPIMDIMIVIFQAVWEVIEFVFPAIQGVIETVWGVLSPIFSAIADALTWVGDAVKSVIGWFGDVFSGVFNKPAEGAVATEESKSKAVGVNRVPYDNYLINAHQGEMLLNRVEADKYQKLGTRGVNLADTSTELSRSSENTSKVSNNSVTKSETKESRPIVIEKFVGFENATISKDADTDDIVDKMVTKFEKLIVNMA